MITIIDDSSFSLARIEDFPISLVFVFFFFFFFHFLFLFTIQFNSVQYLP